VAHGENEARTYNGVTGSGERVPSQSRGISLGQEVRRANPSEAESFLALGGVRALCSIFSNPLQSDKKMQANPGTQQYK